MEQKFWILLLVRKNCLKDFMTQEKASNHLTLLITIRTRERSSTKKISSMSMLILLLVSSSSLSHRNMTI